MDKNIFLSEFFFFLPEKVFSQHFHACCGDQGVVSLVTKCCFFVQEEYVEKFDLGPSSVDLDSMPSFSRPSRSCRKRALSQSKLDSFFTPGTATASGSFSLSDSFLSMSSAKKRRPSSATKSKNKSSAKRKLSSTKGVSRTPSSAKKKKDRRASKSGLMQSPNKVAKLLSLPLKSPQGKSSALKALNKAKKFKQMDLKNSVINKSSMNPIELAELRLKAELERQRRAALLDEEKQRRKELRLRRLREQKEQRRLEKLRQKELLKPREDLLCEDSKVSKWAISGFSLEHAKNSLWANLQFSETL